MTPFEAPGNLLKIESNQSSVAQFVQKLRYFKVRMSKDEWEKGSEKRFNQSPSRMKGSMHDDLHLLNSIKNGKESKSITCLWNRQKNESYFMILLIFFYFLYLYIHFQPFWASWGPLGGPLGAMAPLWGPSRAPMSSLTSIAPLTMGLVQSPVHLGKFTDYWSLPKQQHQSQS